MSDTMQIIPYDESLQRQQQCINFLWQKLEAGDFDRWPRFFLERMLTREKERLANLKKLLVKKSMVAE